MDETRQKPEKDSHITLDEEMESMGLKGFQIIDAHIISTRTAKFIPQLWMSRFPDNYEDVSSLAIKLKSSVEHIQREAKKHFITSNRLEKILKKLREIDGEGLRAYLGVSKTDAQKIEMIEELRREFEGSVLTDVFKEILQKMDAAYVQKTEEQKATLAMIRAAYEEIVEMEKKLAEEVNKALRDQEGLAAKMRENLADLQKELAKVSAQILLTQKEIGQLQERKAQVQQQTQTAIANYSSNTSTVLASYNISIAEKDIESVVKKSIQKEVESVQDTPLSDKERAEKVLSAVNAEVQALIEANPAYVKLSEEKKAALKLKLEVNQLKIALRTAVEGSLEEKTLNSQLEIKKNELTDLEERREKLEQCIKQRSPLIDQIENPSAKLAATKTVSSESHSADKAVPEPKESKKKSPDEAASESSSFTLSLK